jgi:hypothetical protein
MYQGKCVQTSDSVPYRPAELLAFLFNQKFKIYTSCKKYPKTRAAQR